MGVSRLHKEELFDLYSSSNIIRVLKSKRTRWVGHKARAEDRRGAYRVSEGVLVETDHLKDIDVDWKIILKWIFMQ